MLVCHTFNNIVGEFFGSREISSAYRRYDHQVMIVKVLPPNSNMGVKETMESEIIFLVKNIIGIYPCNNDPMVITGKYVDLKIKSVLNDQGIFADILYRDTFNRLCQEPYDLIDFQGSLVGFLANKCT